MLWQIEKQKKPWELKFRLAGWSKKSFSRNDEVAAIRLEKTKAKQGGQATTGQAPKSVGVIDAYVPSDHAIALARKEKVADTLEEYPSRLFVPFSLGEDRRHLENENKY